MVQVSGAGVMAQALCKFDQHPEACFRRRCMHSTCVDLHHRWCTASRVRLPHGCSRSVQQLVLMVSTDDPLGQFDCTINGHSLMGLVLTASWCRHQMPVSSAFSPDSCDHARALHMLGDSCVAAHKFLNNGSRMSHRSRSRSVCVCVCCPGEGGNREGRKEATVPGSSLVNGW